MAKYYDGLDSYSEELKGTSSSSEFWSLSPEEIRKASDETLKTYLGQLEFFDETVRGSIEYMILEELKRREREREQDQLSR